MKTISKTLLIAFCLAAGSSAGWAQGIATTGSDIPRAVSVKEPAPVPAPVAAREVTLTIRNNAERPVAIFAGPKEGIRDPKVKTLGGLSLNKLYLMENEVVCLMDMKELKPMACTVIRPGATFVEVNPSATTITSK